MTVHCADCTAFICRLGGQLEATPDFCPMRGEFPDFEELYSESGSRDLLIRSALVEAKGYCRWTRLKEVGEFARIMGYRRVGLAHCPDMTTEAEQIGDHLRSFGLESVLPGPSLAGDPIAQAETFQERNTDLNLLCGMCVAHEVLFLGHVQTPTVGLIARDARLHHNPVAALYTSRSYLKAELFGHWPTGERTIFRGRDEGTLDEMTCKPRSPLPNPRSRLAEAMDVAHGLGAQHIGLSFCVGFREEAKTLTRLLETNGFRVSSICCKTGAMPKEEAGISDEEKVRPGTAEMLCNPLAQADLLNRDEVQFTFSLGQCVGHDAATLRHIRGPAICLVAKDRVLAHNTVAALNLESRSKTFRAIGYVENGLPFGTHRDTLVAAESRIALSPEYVPGLAGLEKEPRVLVVFLFHRSQGWELEQHPRGDETRPSRGVFALRSPRRPNSIGVTEVELLGIRENVLTVRGLDAVDGTPVLDLKPA